MPTGASVGHHKRNAYRYANGYFSGASGDGQDAGAGGDPGGGLRRRRGRRHEAAHGRRTGLQLWVTPEQDRRCPCQLGTRAGGGRYFYGYGWTSDSSDPRDVPTWGSCLQPGGAGGRVAPAGIATIVIAVLGGLLGRLLTNRDLDRDNSDTHTPPG